MSADFIKKMQFVYDNLCDEKSRDIFLNRLLWNITDEYEFIEKIAIKQGPLVQWARPASVKIEILNKVKQHKDNLIVYGAGEIGKTVAKLLLRNAINVKCFWDSNAKRIKSLDVPVPIYEPFSNYNNETILIGSYKFSNEMLALLRHNGIPEEKIVFPKYMKDFMYDFRNQYFDENIIVFENAEVFVDAGSFDFGSSCQLLEKTGNRVKKIYAFEPDLENFNKIEATIKKSMLENVTVFNAGLWSKKNILKFKANLDFCSLIDESGETEIEVVALDSLDIPEKITFIKMDIEGAELEALKGAQNRIKKDKPKLAICVYHKPEDIIDIPFYIKKLVPDYKLFMRHYSEADFETVLYAVM